MDPPNCTFDSWNIWLLQFWHFGSILLQCLCSTNIPAFAARCYPLKYRVKMNSINLSYRHFWWIFHMLWVLVYPPTCEQQIRSLQPLVKTNHYFKYSSHFQLIIFKCRAIFEWYILVYCSEVQWSTVFRINPFLKKNENKNNGHKTCSVLGFKPFYCNQWSVWMHKNSLTFHSLFWFEFV